MRTLLIVAASGSPFVGSARRHVAHESLVLLAVGSDNAWARRLANDEAGASRGGARILAATSFAQALDAARDFVLHQGDTGVVAIAPDAGVVGLAVAAAAIEVGARLVLNDCTTLREPARATVGAFVSTFSDAEHHILLATPRDGGTHPKNFGPPLPATTVALLSLRRRGFVVASPSNVALTSAGNHLARHVLRA